MLDATPTAHTLRFKQLLGYSYASWALPVEPINYRAISAQFRFLYEIYTPHNLNLTQLNDDYTHLNT